MDLRRDYEAGGADAAFVYTFANQAVPSGAAGHDPTAAAAPARGVMHRITLRGDLPAGAA